MTDPSGNPVPLDFAQSLITIVLLGIIGLCAVGIYQLIQSAAA